MPLWRQLVRGLRVLTNRRAADEELADEVDHYIAQTAAANIALGMSPVEARRAARMAVGNATMVREQVRTSGWDDIVDSLIADIRFGARRLRGNPAFAIVSAVTLAIGIGASTAIFSAVNPILFEALPYPQADRIAMISDVGAGRVPLAVAFGTYRELLQRNQSFESMAAVNPWRPTMTSDAEPEQLVGQRVNASFFHALGVAPILGRDFQESEDRANGPNVVILSSALWRRRFAGDQSIIGRAIKLYDTTYVVVGVMPQTFENVLAPTAELWTPLQYNTSFGPDDREWGHHLRVVARLRPGVSFAQATQELAVIARTPAPDFPRVPWASLRNGLLVTSLQADVTRGVRPALLAVLGAVALLLVIACVNVTNLLLARSAQRRGEFAMRAALGAGRMRLVRQLLTESMLMALIGGLLGIAVAELAVRGLVALSPAGLPRLGAIRVDGAVLTFGFVVTTIIGAAVGAIPAIQVSREGLHAGLQRSSRRTAGAHSLTRSALVVAEVALALVLLVGAGLLLRSISRIFAVDAGFDSSRLLTMQVQESGRRFADDTARYRFYSAALDAVRAVPGVKSAAFTSQLPLSGDNETFGVHFERDGDANNDGAALRYAVTPGYFDVMRIPLRRGRLLDERDGSGAPRAAVINESFARRVFSAQDPIGQRLRFGLDDGRWYTIVGIVGDVRQESIALDEPDAIYTTPTQWHWVDPLMSLVIRARDDGSLASVIRAAVWSVDKNQPIVRVATMQELVGRSIADRRFALILFEAFGIVALTLAATGIYGVLSGSVTERFREIGVRAALGATRGDIISLIVRQGMTLTVIGVAIGASGAWLASRAIVTMLFGVSRLDPATYAGVIALLATVSVIACCVPAWRAARVDPSITLRAE